MSSALFPVGARASIRFRIDAWTLPRDQAFDGRIGVIFSDDRANDYLGGELALRLHLEGDPPGHLVLLPARCVEVLPEPSLPLAELVTGFPLRELRLAFHRVSSAGRARLPIDADVRAEDAREISLYRRAVFFFTARRPSIELLPGGGWIRVRASGAGPAEGRS